MTEEKRNRLKEFYSRNDTELSNIISWVENILKDQHYNKTGNLPFIPVGLIDEIIKDGGFELIESDINGFQVDFWNTYKKNDKVFVLSGSLYYGDFKLTKKEDE